MRPYTVLLTNEQVKTNYKKAGSKEQFFMRALIKKITSSQFYCRSCSILFKRNRSTHPMLNPNADVKMIRLKSMLQFTLIHIGCYMLFDFEEFYSINATFLIFFRLLHKAKRFLTQKNRKRRRIV